MERSHSLFKQLKHATSIDISTRQHQVIYWLSTTAILTTCAALIARAVQLGQDNSSSPATQYGTLTLLISWVSAMVLNHLEHRQDVRSSTYIYAFYVLTLAASAIHIRTMHDLALTAQSQFASFCVFFGALIVGFVVEAWPRNAIVRNQDILDQDLPTAYDQSNLVSRLCFHFMQSVISKGYKQPLVDDDVANMMPRRIRTVHSYDLVSQEWDRHVAKCRTKGNKKPSLLWVVLKAGRWSWLPILVFSLLASIMEYVQPLLLDVILSFISSYSTDSPSPPVYGIILSIGMFVSALLASLASGQFYQIGTNLGLEFKAGLVSMIYRKSLKLSPNARRETTVGEISNHMSVDAERISQAVTHIPGIVSAPFEICVGMWMLYRQLGPSAFTGLGVVLMIIPIQTLIGKTLNTAKDKKLEAMDNRVRLMNEILSSIKIVKLYSWERSFREKLDVVRKKELNHLRHIGIAVAFMMIMYTSLPTLITLLSFTVYALAGGPGGARGTMSAQVVFVSVTLFGRLAKPIGRLSQIVSQSISFNVAVKRIQSFLLQEELEDAQIEYFDGPSQQRSSLSESGYSDGLIQVKRSASDVTLLQAGSKAVSISVQDATFSWDQTTAESKKEMLNLKEQKSDRVTTPTSDQGARPALVDINLEIPSGSLSILMGRVGQGKSSLLGAIIGDMYKHKGRVRVYGQLAYVPQQAWIINASLRENILFGNALDQERYDRITAAVGLIPDFKMLPAGDLTEIGERGINLSGGQRQRVSLARAAYQDADIYLLDDPLSAVDAHVDQHLWENLIGPEGLLNDKTRLLVTHGIHHLSEADQIIVIKSGQIDETGKYEDLMNDQGSFFKLVSEYSVKERQAEKGEQQDESGDQSTVNIAKDDIKTVDAPSPATGTEMVKEDDNAQLIMEEEAAAGSVGWKVFMNYCKAGTYIYSFLGIILFVFSQASQIGINLWLQRWAGREGTDRQDSIGAFLGVYAALVVLYIGLDVSVNLIIFIQAGYRASTLMHNNLLQRVLRLPMSFFDTTPVGRIMNRFSSDVDNMDELLPFFASDFYFFLSTVLGTLIVISFSVPIFLAVIPFLVVLYLIIQTYYIRSARALKRIYSISKSPLYQHFGETLAGVSTIRALRVSDQFIRNSAAKSDQSSNAYFAYTISNRWMHIRLEFLGSIVVLATALLAVLGRETLGPAMAGLALSYSLNATYGITLLVTSFSELQNQLVSVERIREYSEKNTEAPDVNEGVDDQLPPNWPRQGSIVFKNYSTRYRQGMDLVIKDISFTVAAGEKVGIVGRTGAGKSSLTLALFRIIEAANSHWAIASHNGADSDAEPNGGEIGKAPKDLEKVAVEEDGGSIEIDGVDISTVGLETLRKHLAIIPQDPTLFAGTVRENLDPFDQVGDVELWEALERAHLKEYISTMPGGLSYEVAQNGDNFSVGQRSLICLARALLRKTKILVLDEATAAVDVETDELIQKTIRQEFKDRTILTIAHRIKTVMDSDKILVLEKGWVQEYDSPSELLKKGNSLFYSLAQKAGEV
ncbi:Multidrug resistance-associated protein 1 [Podila minutissima]|uniref:Multidrug resistance-associated protein 1 n=1 Tax=Podila minutissima TaxID=64525 RepID=A0A9P5SGW6_9FUNG|nr:Multidrug resistance-associated protein 1 [Podila minutissima]